MLLYTAGLLLCDRPPSPYISGDQKSAGLLSVFLLFDLLFCLWGWVAVLPIPRSGLGYAFFFGLGCVFGFCLDEAEPILSAWAMLDGMG